MQIIKTCETLYIKILYHLCIKLYKLFLVAIGVQFYNKKNFFFLVG